MIRSIDAYNPNQGAAFDPSLFRPLLGVFYLLVCPRADLRTRGDTGYLLRRERLDMNPKYMSIARRIAGSSAAETTDCPWFWVLTSRIKAAAWRGGRSISPNRFNHPVRWTSITKGQVWNPPPRLPGSGQLSVGADWVFDTG